MPLTSEPLHYLYIVLLSLKSSKRDKMALFGPVIIMQLIPLFLLAFGILYVILGIALHAMDVHLALPVAILAIAGSLAWFLVSGNGWVSDQVFTVVGLGIVGVVLAKIFAG